MSSPDAIPEPKSSLSFTQGLLLGQLSIVILIGAFIKFFIFGDPPSADATAALRATERRSRTLAHKRSLLSVRASHGRDGAVPATTPPAGPTRKRSSLLRNSPMLTPATILSKTYYNVHSHQPESLDWFNVLIAQTIAQLRSDAQREGAILQSLTDALNGSSRPDFLDEIKVTELGLGEDFPIFSNCRIIPVDEDGLTYGGPSVRGRRGGMDYSLPKEAGRLQARMDVDLSDFITLALETKLLLNFPKPQVAVLPVAISVSVVRFSGTLCISFMPGSGGSGGGTSTGSGGGSSSGSSTGGDSGPGGGTTLGFHFLDDYRLDFSIRSLVGSRSRLQDVPKIAQLVESRLHTWFDERCVEPVFQQIPLPNFWPRKKNTRGGEDVVVDGAPGAGGPSPHSRPGSMSRAMGKEIQRDLREEARREVEAEVRLRERDRLREQERQREVELQRERELEARARSRSAREGLRLRRRERSPDFVMPGSLPGTSMS